MTSFRRKLLAFALAALLGGLLGYFHSPVWLMYAATALFVAVCLPWVMEGKWWWQMWAERDR